MNGSLAWLRLADAVPPGEAIVEARLSGTQWPNIGRLLTVPGRLGEALWRPPAPNGYPDTEAAWIDGVPRRLDVANEFAGHAQRASRSARSAERSFGSLASCRYAAKPSRGRKAGPQAFALLVMAPRISAG